MPRLIEPSAAHRHRHSMKAGYARPTHSLFSPSAAAALPETRALSSAARAVTVILLARLHPRPLAWMPFVPRIMGVRPNAGTIDAPMVTLLEEAENERDE